MIDLGNEFVQFSEILIENYRLPTMVIKEEIEVLNEK